MGRIFKTNLDNFDNAESSLQKLMANSYNLKILMEHFDNPKVEVTNESLLLFDNISTQFEENLKVVGAFFNSILITE